jgi:hypothetical protein
METSMNLVRDGLAMAATLLGLAACATASAPPGTGGAATPAAGSAAPSDEDLATARAACAAVAAGAEHDRCIEVQLRRARGSRNTY